MASLCIGRLPMGLLLPPPPPHHHLNPSCSAQSPAVPTLKLPAPKVLQNPLTTRFKSLMCSQETQKLFTVFASNSNPSGEDSKKDKPETSETTQGPPLLTILAGFLVFFLVIWVLGSIIMWLFGLIVNVPPGK